MEEKIEEVSITKEGISLKSVTLNTLLTLLSVIGVATLSVITWQHQLEAKAEQTTLQDALREQTTAIREQTAVQRENTCMLKFDQKDRQANADFCKQVSGVSYNR